MTQRASQLKVTDLDGPSRSQEASTLEPQDQSFSSASWSQLVIPPLHSKELTEQFDELYNQIPALWKRLQSDGHVEQTVVVVPSLSLDAEELGKLKGARHYEERLLFLLILLGLPRTRVVFITSEPIDPSIVDYYLQLLPGVPFSHARKRLTMLSTYDSSPTKSLSQKVLERPALMRRIRKEVNHCPNRHLTVFNVTELEKQLSVALGTPLLGPDPKYLRYGTKSGARQLFRQQGLLLADGIEDLKDEEDIIKAIWQLAQRNPDSKRLVIKINDGFSGDGNALIRLDFLDRKADLEKATPSIRQALEHNLSFQAPGVTWDSYIKKFKQMEGIVETFIEGDPKESPSVQVRITPEAEAQIVSTHDQVLGGPDGQVFIGCRFPAEGSYRQQLHQAGLKIGQKLAQEGVIGRLSIDFLAVPKEDETWDLYAVEINLRKGGTTHPFRTLQFLTNGRYDEETGLYSTSSGHPKYYFASDNLESPKYAGLLPQDLIELSTYYKLHYNTSTSTGVIFHMIGALSEFGKVGVTCIGDSPEHAQELYDNVLVLLDKAVEEYEWIL